MTPLPSNHSLPHVEQAPDNQPPRSTLSPVLALRLAQGQVDLACGAPVLADVSVDKPPPAHFFRVRPGEEFSATFNLLDAKKMGGDGWYAVGPQVVGLVADQTRLVQLRLAVTQFGAPYLVPVHLPAPDGRSNSWNVSRTRAVTLAETRWIRMSSDMRIGAYQIFEALGHLGEPKWPSESFDELLDLALRNRIIESEDHPLVQQLLGKV